MLDPATFRAALSRLASGVSIVTTVDADGRDHGMTVTALSSLSLIPPLILVCVDRTATMYPHLTSASRFAASLLTREQQGLSERFAAQVDDRFDGVPIARGTTGCALIEDALAHLECEMWAAYDGGDHTIFVGRVLHAATSESRPLLYFRGRYTQVRG
jgi:flavin reductase (DIM6/NTAB) family NADH-FMN oxidoreductase RutF